MDNSIVFIYYNPMDMESRRVEAELQLQNRGKNDPERPPRPERGDFYIIIGLVVGAVTGVILGSFVGFLGFIGGAIVGGIIGATIGGAIKKYLQKRKNKTSSENSLI